MLTHGVLKTPCTGRRMKEPCDLCLELDSEALLVNADIGYMGGGSKSVDASYLLIIYIYMYCIYIHGINQQRYVMIFGQPAGRLVAK